MKAVIEVDVPEYQIGQEVSVYFKDTMCVKGVCKKKQTRKEKTSSDDSSAWDFHYSGHGDYEEERRCFYGDFG